jgi:predicted metal-binding membrane protein
MSDAALEAVLRRDRLVVLTALVAVALFAWAYILWLAADMNMGTGPGGGETTMGPAAGSAMDGAGSSMMAMATPAARPWAPATFVFMFGMWAVMMVGMMLPSVAPMLLIHARVARQSLAQDRPFAPTAWFAGGYLLAWTGFSAGATAAQWALDQALLITPMMASASPYLGAGILIAAGLYQWSPLKDVCLTQCQSPLLFIQRNGGFRRDVWGSLRLGLRHGLYCIGCCWVLMTLLFVGGVMNLLWIAAIAILVLLEKIVPAGRLVARTAGVALVAAGVLLLV